MPAKVVTSFNFKKEEKEEIARIYETGQALRIEASGFSRALY
jgi:wyosine [tRNA(Phe)-imidazoG37] synthetase (radical SAM superfamily)